MHSLKLNITPSLLAQYNNTEFIRELILFTISHTTTEFATNPISILKQNATPLVIYVNSPRHSSEQDKQFALQTYHWLTNHELTKELKINFYYY